MELVENGDKTSAAAPAQVTLPATLVAPEASPNSVIADATGRAEAASLTAWWRARFSKENVDLTSNVIDMGLRTAMSVAFLVMAWWWLCVVGKIVERQFDCTKPLSDATLVALLTTTTINVLGLLYFVANYLFPKKLPSKESDNSVPPPPRP